MNKSQPIISNELLLAAFRALTPDNQKALIECLKALAPSSGQTSDSDD